MKKKDRLPKTIYVTEDKSGALFRESNLELQMEDEQEAPFLMVALTPEDVVGREPRVVGTYRLVEEKTYWMEQQMRSE